MNAVLKQADDHAEQREFIERFIDRNPWQEGLFSEAVGESKYRDEIRETFYHGDTARLGVLVERAMREYIYKIAQEHYQ